MDHVFDVHAHLTDSNIYADLLDHKIKLPHKILSAGYSHESNIKTVKLKRARLENVFISLGISAQEAIKDKSILRTDKLHSWIEYIRSNKSIVTAIGEIGLDYHWTNLKADIERERKLFRIMLETAEEMQLPVIVHSRKAEADVINELLSYRLNGVILHCFSGDVRLARTAVDNDMFISIPPVSSRRRRKMIKTLGLNHLVVETDLPYIGKSVSDINKSLNIISNELGIDMNNVAMVTHSNAMRALGLGSADEAVDEE